MKEIQIPAWKANDGSIYHNKDDCKRHENEVALKSLFDRTWPYLEDYSQDTVIEWILNNPRALRDILKEDKE